MANSRFGNRTRLGAISNYITGNRGYEADAQAFFNASGITDETIKNAIQQLVVDLKGYEIWTKMKAIYPFVGGTASTHKWNLKNPQDTDAAFRLVFFGGITHSTTGAKFNGTSGYSDTKLNASTVLSSASHLSWYTRTNGNTATDEIDIGLSNFWLSLWYNGSGFNNILARNQSGSVLLNGGTVTNSQGFGITTKIGSTAKIFKNGTQVDSKTDSTTTFSNGNIFLGAMNNVGVGANFYTIRECSFASIGDGLTDTEAADFNTAVQAFQTTLGRQV